MNSVNERQEPARILALLVNASPHWADHQTFVDAVFIWPDQCSERNGARSGAPPEVAPTPASRDLQ